MVVRCDIKSDTLKNTCPTKPKSISAIGQLAVRRARAARANVGPIVVVSHAITLTRGSSVRVPKQAVQKAARPFHNCIARVLCPLVVAAGCVWVVYLLFAMLLLVT